MVHNRRPRFSPQLDEFERRDVPSFAGPVNYATDTEPVTVAVGDINVDGIHDMVTPNGRGQSVSVFLGNGDGRFQTARNSPAGRIISADIGDFNRDGRPDLAIATVGDYPNFVDNSVSILLGNGDGTFQAPYRVADSGQPFVGDLNGDAILDLTVTSFNFAVNTVGVLLGNGDGTFRLASQTVVPASPLDAKLGDLNRDGALDLVTVSYSSDLLVVLLGNGDGTFQTARQYTAGRFPNSVALADFNRDGILDVAATNQISFLSSYRSTISILLGRGDGSFGPVAPYELGPILSKPLQVVVADFNGDGNMDVGALVRDVPPTYTPVVSVLLSSGDGMFRRATHHRVDAYTQFIAAGDLNGDGLADLATANSEFGNGRVAVYLNDGNWPDPGPGVVIPPDPVEPPPPPTKGRGHKK